MMNRIRFLGQDLCIGEGSSLQIVDVGEPSNGAFTNAVPDLNKLPDLDQLFAPPDEYEGVPNAVASTNAVPDRSTLPIVNVGEPNDVESTNAVPDLNQPPDLNQLFAPPAENECVSNTVASTNVVPDRSALPTVNVAEPNNVESTDAVPDLNELPDLNQLFAPLDENGSVPNTVASTNVVLDQSALPTINVGEPSNVESTDAVPDLNELLDLNCFFAPPDENGGVPNIVSTSNAVSDWSALPTVNVGEPSNVESTDMVSNRSALPTVNVCEPEPSNMEFPSTVPDLNQLPDLNWLSAPPNANVGDPNTGTSSDTVPNRSDDKVAMATSSSADDKVSRPGNKNFHATCSKRKVSTSAEAEDMTMPRASKRISQPTRKALEAIQTERGVKRKNSLQSKCKSESSRGSKRG